MPRSRLTPKERAFVRDYPVGRYAHAGPDGVYIAALCHVLVGNAIYIRTGESTWKVRTATRQRRVAYVVDEYHDDWKANREVQMRGPVEALRSGPEYLEAQRRLMRKYPQFARPDELPYRVAVLKITIDRVSSLGF
jgi:nitroimidazol reductase NimA-like FMN-containing flavoprotein (pyridoxamine 5'-phosphate oxidase superfamily)